MVLRVAVAVEEGDSGYNAPETRFRRVEEVAERRNNVGKRLGRYVLTRNV